MNKRVVSSPGRLIYDITPPRVVPASGTSATDRLLHDVSHASHPASSVRNAPSPVASAPSSRPRTIEPARAIPRSHFARQILALGPTLRRINWQAVVFTRSFILLTAIAALSLTASVVALHGTSDSETKTSSTTDPASSVHPAEVTRDTSPTAPTASGTPPAPQPQVIQRQLPANNAPQPTPAAPSTPQPEPTPAAPTPTPTPTPTPAKPKPDPDPPAPEPDPTPDPPPAEP